MSTRVLIVDDERNIRRTLSLVLGSAGYECLEADSGEAALGLLENEVAHAVLLDIGLPGQDGLQTLEAIRRSHPGVAVIMISGRATIQDALDATKLGAFDFLEKPLSRDRVLLALRNALQISALETEIDRIKGRAEERILVGESPRFLHLLETARKVARTHATVLITGESGTGKELIARFIHEESPRATGPFVEVNCAAIPEDLIESELFGCIRGAYTGADRAREGKFEAANGGTLFLDEIGDMSPKVQAKVLRALQERVIERVGESASRPVDVRILAATNRNLAAEVETGRFREDLFHRIHVVPLETPPLRERPEDTARLAVHFAHIYAKRNGLPVPILHSTALERLATRRWPGNVRELRNAIERLVILSPGPEIGGEDVDALVPDAGVSAVTTPIAEDSPRRSDRPDDRPKSGAGVMSDPLALVREHGGLPAARDAFEQFAIEAALDASGGNVSEAARLLGVERSNLHKKISKYELNPVPRGERIVNLGRADLDAPEKEDQVTQSAFDSSESRQLHLRAAERNTSWDLDPASLAESGAGEANVTPLRGRGRTVAGTVHGTRRRGARVSDRLGILGDWIGAEDPAPDSSDEALFIEDAGGGVSVLVGYDWTRHFGLAFRMSGARHDTTLEDLTVAHNSAEIEAHWRPGSNPDVRPYLFGGIGGNTLRVDTDLADVDTRGGSAVLGSGVLVRLRGNFWFDLAGRLQFINWDEIEVTLSDGQGDQVSASTPVDESGTAGQVTVGVLWGF
ncbi:MAG: sigma 54-interacting transcriptional regulator [Candidatus Eisenbacteria bacterium]